MSIGAAEDQHIAGRIQGRALTFVEVELCPWQQRHRADEDHGHKKNMCLRYSQTVAAAGLSNMRAALVVSS